MSSGERPFLTKAVAARRADRRPQWRPNRAGEDRREGAGGSGSAIDSALGEDSGASSSAAPELASGLSLQSPPSSASPLEEPTA